MMTEDAKKELPVGEEVSYHLKRCRVKVINQSYRDVVDGKNRETKSVLLIPDSTTTEASKFFGVYLPEVGTICLSCHAYDLEPWMEKCPHCGLEKIKTEFTEVVGYVAAPADSHSRMALMRKNSNCDKHHLFVMSTGVELDLMSLDGKKVDIEILSSGEDHKGDDSKTVVREVDRRYDNVSPLALK